MTEQDVTLKGNKKTLEQRLKQVSSTLKSLQKQHDKLSTGTAKYFQSIEKMNSIARFKIDLIKHQKTEKKLKDMSSEEATKQRHMLKESENIVHSSKIRAIKAQRMF